MGILKPNIINYYVLYNLISTLSSYTINVKIDYLITLSVKQQNINSNDIVVFC